MHTPDLQVTQNPLCNTRHQKNLAAACSNVDIRENERMSSPWSKLVSGFLSRVSHPGRKKVGTSDVIKDNMVLKLKLVDLHLQMIGLLEVHR